jgi:cysteine/glycine-rich protein
LKDLAWLGFARLNFVGGRGRGEAMAFQGTQQKCKACDKTVYLVDQLTADGVIYHKACFRCAYCKSTLKLGNYASLEGVLYCKPHFNQLFKRTGSYEKSFEKFNVQDGVVKAKSLSAESKTDEVKAPSKFASHFSGTQDKCVACSKTVYPIEKTSVEGLSYHKNCFKCVHGGCVLSPSNYAALEGRLYCKHHYSQLFKEKGNYSQLTNKAPPVKAGLTHDS